MATTTTPVAIVTGSIKGIGLSIVKLLCLKHPDWHVYLTSRDVERGREAVEQLHDKFGVSPQFHQLDVGSLESVRAFADFIRKNHPQGITALVNNAAITASAGVNDPTTATFIFNRQLYRDVMAINYFGVINVAQELFPLLVDGARVVNVSSTVGQIAFSQFSPAVQELWRKCSTIDDVSALVKQFLELENKEAYENDGWSSFPIDKYLPQRNRFAGDSLAYGVSKLAVNVVTQLFQKQFDTSDDKKKQVAVNACTPGHVLTGMNIKGVKTTDQGAETPVFLATLPRDSELRGKFVDDKQNVVDVFANMM